VFRSIPSLFIIHLNVNNKLFVGNISWNTTEDDLKKFFEQVGEVLEAKIIMDRIKNRSKGMGFVTMATDELAAEAIEKLNGQDLDSRPIRVDKARPPQKREGGDFKRF
jgi:cold-inducible RNA-binding protein